MTIDLNSLIAVGVGAQLLGSIAKTLFKKPQQQAQIDRIEAKVNDTLATVAPVLSALKSTNVQSPDSNLLIKSPETKGTPAQ